MPPTPSTITPDLVLYHANCQDGLAAAWAVWRRFSALRTTYTPVSYGEAPPDVTGKHVVIVDFSYSYEVLLAMSYKAASILVLDHHKTARDALARLPEAAPIGCHTGSGWEEFHADTAAFNASQNTPLVGTWFDMTRSGAMLAWNFFHDGPPPKLLRYVEDRDLWRFLLPNSREVHAATSSYPHGIEHFDRLVHRCAADPGLLIMEGKAVLRSHDKDVATFAKLTRRTMRIGGYNVPVANLPPSMASDAGHLLSEAHPFAATYYDAEGGRVFSLRSREDGMDVSAIASQYGGGGHKHAAGFRAPPGWDGDTTMGALTDG